MTDIDKIKHSGAVQAMKCHIDNLKHRLIERNWSGIREGTQFTRLGDAIADARLILTQMEEALEALRELEAGNK